MHPTLFSLGPIAISSFGFFLALAFLSATFIAWRLAKTYDLNEEKVLDIAMFTFFGGLIGARLYFVLFNWEIFSSFEKAFLINRYPGLSIWGGILGGVLTLWFFCKRAKLNIWQIADFAAVSFLLSLVFGNLGCFLGGCNFGAASNSPLAVSVVGLMGKRLPIPLFEGILSLIAFTYLWKQVVRFHFFGKILSLSLIFLGFIKLISELNRGNNQYIPYLLLILGIFIFYYRSKKSFMADLNFLTSLPKSEKRRQLVLSKLRKNWYNYQIHLRVKLGKTKHNLGSLPKIIKRRLNVKSTPKNIIEN